MAHFLLRPRTWRTVDAATGIYVKRTWAGTWERLPYAYAKTCTDVLAPNIPEATIEAHFGNIRRTGGSAFATWLPYFANGAYIQIKAFARWEVATLFVGVIDVETVRPHGDTARASGVQTFQAYGLEQLLDRDTMRGSYTTDGFVDREIVFNAGRTFGLKSTSNKQTGELKFGAGDEWTNKDIIDYIIAEYLDTTQITFKLIGDTDPLDDIVEEHDLNNVTPWQALNRLIQRQRGMAWKLITASDGTVYIYVFSLYSFPVQVQDVSIPANAYQTDVYFSGDASVEQVVHFNRQNMYKRIVGVGGDVSVCASFSIADSTLEEDWGSAAETSYKAGTGTPADDAALHDANRSRDEWESVYQRFRVPDTWDGKTADGQGNATSNAIPVVNKAGYLDTATQSSFHREGITFEREIPLAQTKNAGGISEYRRPFLLCKVADPGGGADIYAMSHKLNTLEYDNISLNMADTDLAIQTDSALNHVGALNHFDEADVGTEDSNVTPITDFDNYIFTGFFKTGEKVVVDSVNLGYPVGETDRTKVIQLPEAEIWYIVPTTVYGVDDGAPLEHAGGTLRDDGKWVRLAVYRALAWYGQPRAQLEYRIKYVSAGLPAGTLVRSMYGPEGATAINTVVTRRAWDFTPGAQNTTVQTGFVELEFSKHGDFEAHRRAGRIRRLQRRAAKLPGRRG